MKAGDQHYKAYVGPPENYAFMGATQFRLLCTLGLEESDRLLDFGCGSLRAGKYFINYLSKGNYFGVDPNRWLIEESIEKELGKDIINIKAPTFYHNDTFKVESEYKFDFIIAQSIFSHTGLDLTSQLLESFASVLQDDGLIVATFVDGGVNFEGNGWVYPDCVKYKPDRIKRFSREVGLEVQRIPWYHPSQTWYVFAKKRSRLPCGVMLKHLHGAVVLSDSHSRSWKRWPIFKNRLKNFIRFLLPDSIVRVLRKLR